MMILAPLFVWSDSFLIFCHPYRRICTCLYITVSWLQYTYFSTCLVILSRDLPLPPPRPPPRPLLCWCPRKFWNLHNLSLTNVYSTGKCPGRVGRRSWGVYVASFTSVGRTISNFFRITWNIFTDSSDVSIIATTTDPLVRDSLKHFPAFLAFVEKNMPIAKMKNSANFWSLRLVRGGVLSYKPLPMVTNKSWLDSVRCVLSCS